MEELDWSVVESAGLALKLKGNDCNLYLDCSYGSNHLMGPSIWKHLLVGVCVCVCLVSFLSWWITALWRLVLVAAYQQSPWRSFCVCCALIGRSWNILFYLIVCSPATQTPVSQSGAGFKDPPLGLKLERSTSLGNKQCEPKWPHAATVMKSVCSCEECYDWISRPCVSVQSHHAQKPSCKTRTRLSSGLLFFVIYQTITLGLTWLFEFPRNVLLIFFM